MKRFILLFLPALAAAQGLQFYPFGPCRLVDTRGTAFGFAGQAPFSGPSLAPMSTTVFPFLSSAQAATTAPSPCGQIPATAQGYALNITVVPQAQGAVDYITVWPAPAPGATAMPRPVVATLNDPQGMIVQNAATISDGGGGIQIYNAGPSTTDIVIDINGYYAPGQDGATGAPPWPVMWNGPGMPLYPNQPGMPPGTALACLPYSPVGYSGMPYASPGNLYYEPGAQTPVATVVGSPFTLTYAVVATDTPMTIAAALAALVSGNAGLVTAGVTVSVDGMGDLTLAVPAALGVFGLIANFGTGATAESMSVAGNEVTVSGTATAGDTAILNLSFSAVTTTPDQLWVCMIGKSQTGEWVAIATAP
jgi:hypothetical protein